MSVIPANECYQHLGFTPFDGQGPSIEASLWRQLQESTRLAEIRQRYLLQRDCSGQPLVDHGYIVGRLPELRLAENELNRLLEGLEQGLAAGCTTVQDWQALKMSQRLK